MRGAKWLLKAHAANIRAAAETITNATTTSNGNTNREGGSNQVGNTMEDEETSAAAHTKLVVNVFELPHAPEKATLWAIMLGGDITSATLSTAYLPESGAAGATSSLVSGARTVPGDKEIAPIRIHYTK